MRAGNARIDTSTGECRRMAQVQRVGGQLENAEQHVIPFLGTVVTRLDGREEGGRITSGQLGGATLMTHIKGTRGERTRGCVS